MSSKKWLRFPVVSEGAEYLVMGYLMRRNVLTYKAPQNNEGYDLIAIHPDPRHQPKKGQPSQLRIQVKSRYATDCGRGFPVKEVSLDAFDYLVVAFLNIGKFSGKNDGTEGALPVEFYSLSSNFIKEHIDTSTSWEKVKLGQLTAEIECFSNDNGFDVIADSLGVPRPAKPNE